MDKIIARLVSLGVPGLILLIAIATSGLAGGAAIMASLALLGGPFGAIGGILGLGLIVLISNAIAEYGAESILEGVLRGLKEKGMTKSEIIKDIDGRWISLELKLKLKAYVDQFFPPDDPPASA